MLIADLIFHFEQYNYDIVNPHLSSTNFNRPRLETYSIPTTIIFHHEQRSLFRALHAGPMVCWKPPNRSGQVERIDEQAYLLIESTSGDPA